MEARIAKLCLKIFACGWFLWSCAGPSETSNPAGDGGLDDLAREGAYSLFTDVTKEAGIDFTHFNDATVEKLLPETMGSGVAFFDFDNDGLPDLYFVNGAPIRGNAEATPTGRLYRNRGDGTFEDVTAGSGLEETFFGMGVAVGDLENDGQLDLAVTGTDRLRIYRNLGKGRFENVTTELGASCPGFGSSLAFVDYDRDGWLDLYVGRYVEWTADTDIPCSPDGIHRTYCTPEVYPAISNVLFRNVEGKRLEDVSVKARIRDLKGKTLGVVVLDFNNDGWPDIAVANDTVGNFLLVNQKDGTFVETGVDTGMAYSESGAARGGMGIDAGDIDRDGQVDIVIGNFSQEMVAFFRSLDSGYFIDDAAQVGVGLPTLMTLAFGTLLEDFDNDGWLDLMVVNGHIEPNIAETRRSQAYRQPPQFFKNLGEGQFEEPDANAIGPTQKLLVARGFASADYDGDGDVDFVISQNGAAACFLRNNTTGDNWLQVRLHGRKSNRTGLGAKVTIEVEGSRRSRYVVSGRSYLSACDPLARFGLGSLESVERLEVTWPSGAVQVLENPPINQLLVLEEE